jgi:DNA-binding NarL/FixJ family response regulator
VRVVIAEDSVLLREGLARLLDEAGFEVVEAVPDAEQLLRSVAEQTPDVVVADVRMPPTHTDEGLRAALVIRQRWPKTAVLVLSQYVEERYASDLLAAGGVGIGYLLKERVADVGEFVDSVRRVAEGGTAFDPEVVAQLISRRRKDDPLSDLTPREREVLELMAEGLTNNAISKRLWLTVGAVEKHISSIFARLGLLPGDDENRRVRAVLTYLESAR